MRIPFSCDKCGVVQEAEAQLAGQTVNCRGCQTPLTVPPARLAPGVTIGGFRIKKLLARGGMGEVYLAEQLSLGRDVALKILPQHFKSDPETVRRFLTEVRTAAKLLHPNLVTVYEAGEDNGIYFLAMAYIEGETLDTILERQGRLPESQALQIAHDIATALADAWQSHRLIHCDIKPGNIMVDHHGKPYLMDMGLSRLLAETTAAGHRTSDAFGTPNYVSPEQSFNEPNLDFRSDMFSLGMTLYHMLTGHLPFAAPTPAETLRKLDTETLPDPRTIVPGISPGCVVLLERMLARKPIQRYPSWEAFLKECQRVRKGGKPTLPPLRPGESVLERMRGPATASMRALRGAPPERQEPVPPFRLLREIVGLAVVVFLATLVAYVNRDRLRDFLPKPRPRTAPSEATTQTGAPPVAAVITAAPPAQAQDDRERRLKEQFLAAQSYASENPREFDEIIRRYKAILDEAAGTPWAGKVAAELQQVEAARKRAYEEVRKEIEGQVEILLSLGRLDEAIAYLRNYRGAFREATEQTRLAQAAKLQAQLDKQRIQTEKIQPFLTAVADHLLRGEFPALKQRLAAAANDPDLVASDECRIIREMALKVAAMPDAVVAGLKNDIGKKTLLRTVRGQQEGELVGVEGDVVRLKKTIMLGGQVTGFVEEKYRLNELTAEEWLLRLTEN
ncbi:MAG: protein kinase, partial [Verrucomicrobiae bacterium]|nr:protein kinase [Verrucomicrobiae bacterium]